MLTQHIVNFSFVNQHKEDLGENNSVGPAMWNILTPALDLIFVLLSFSYVIVTVPVSLFFLERQRHLIITLHTIFGDCGALSYN